MASHEVEFAWQTSGLANRADISPHLAFVQGWAAARETPGASDGEAGRGYVESTAARLDAQP